MLVATLIVAVRVQVTAGRFKPPALNPPTLNSEACAECHELAAKRPSDGRPRASQAWAGPAV